MYINGYTRTKVMDQIRARGKAEVCIENNSCKYRSKNGNQCLIGRFIPDDQYSKLMENVPVRRLVKKFPSLEKYMPLDTKYLDDLQYFHDKRIDRDGEEFYQAIENILIEMEQDSFIDELRK